MKSGMLHIFRNSPMGRENLMQSAFFCERQPGLGLADASPTAPGMVVAAMAVPVIDTSTTILRRWRRGVSVFRADDEHLHHRLLRLGTTPHRAAACLWFVTIACASAQR